MLGILSLSHVLYIQVEMLTGQWDYMSLEFGGV